MVCSQRCARFLVRSSPTQLLASVVERSYFEHGEPELGHTPKDFLELGLVADVARERGVPLGE